MAEADQDASGNIKGIRTFQDDIKRLRGDKAPAVQKPPKVKPKKASTSLHVSKKDKASRNAADYLSHNSDSKNDNQNLGDTKAQSKKPAPSTQTKHSATDSTGRNSVTDDLEKDLDQGTVIREKKKRRFKLLPAMMEASKDWAEETKDSLEELAKPKYTVEPAAGRKEKIEQAASYSKRAPTEDYSSVADKLKNVKRDPSSAKLVIKDKAEIKAKDASWEVPVESHKKPAATQPKKNPAEKKYSFNTPKVPSASAFMGADDEKSKPSSETSTTKTDTTDHDSKDSPKEKKKIVLPPPPPPGLEKKENAKPAETTSDEKTPKPVEDKEETKPAPKVETKKETEVTTVTEPEEPNEPESEPEAESIEEKPEPRTSNTTDEPSAADFLEADENEEAQRGPSRPDLRLPVESQYPMSVIATGAVFAIILGITAAWIFIVESNFFQQPEEVVAVAYTALGLPTVDVPFAPDPNVLGGSLLLAADQTTVTRPAAFRVVNESNEPVGATQFMSTLFTDDNAPEVIRTINTATAGVLDGGYIFIVMQGTNFDAMFAGMLAWERTMTQNTLSPFVATSTNPFTDAPYDELEDMPARVLLDESGIETIAYVFINPTTIIIARDRGLIEQVEAAIEL